MNVFGPRREGIERADALGAGGRPAPDAGLLAWRSFLEDVDTFSFPLSAVRGGHGPGKH